MNHISKKILAILTALVMMIAMIPCNAFAGELYPDAEPLAENIMKTVNAWETMDSHIYKFVPEETTDYQLLRETSWQPQYNEDEPEPDIEDACSFDLLDENGERLTFGAYAIVSLEAGKTYYLIADFHVTADFRIGLFKSGESETRVRYYEGVTGGEKDYIVIDKEDGSIVKGTSGITRISIPTEVEGCKVTRIAEYAFSQCPDLESVDDWGNIERIDNNAFRFCKLDKAVLPKTLKHLEREAFKPEAEITLDPENTNMKIEDNVILSYDGTEAMGYVVRSEDPVVIPEGVTTISDFAFLYGDMKSLKLPTTLESIGKSAFELCNQIETVEIPEGIEELGESVFNNCTSLTKVMLPSTLKKIGFNTFNYTESLREITIPDGVVSIGERAFEGSGIKNFKVPGSLEEIGDRALNMYGLQSFETESPYVQISDTAFSEEHEPGIDFVIRGPVPSTAETFADNHNILFEAIDVEVASTFVAGKPSTYTSKGTIDRYYSDTFKKNFADSACTELLTNLEAPLLKLKTASGISPKLYKEYNKVRVSWDKVKGATGYYVYYKKSTSDTWTKKTVTGTSYTTGTLTSGKKYQFKVQAFAKDSNGKVVNKASTSSYKTIYTLKKMSKPSVKKSSSKKVKVSWSKVSGATGYQISKSTSSKKTNIVATVKSQSATSKVLTSKKKKTYYYKVRAYRTVNDKRVYAPWSSVRSYKLK